MVSRSTGWLRSAGTPVELVVFPGVAHGIPSDQLRPPVESFLRRYVLDPVH